MFRRYSFATRGAALAVLLSGVSGAAKGDPVGGSSDSSADAEPQQVHDSSDEKTDGGLQLRTLTLPHGLKVVLQPNPGGAEVAVCTIVGAGARRDPEGRTGASYALAEILSGGGYRSTANDYVKTIEERGGRSTAEVGPDALTFCTTAPASELPLALWVAEGRFTTSAFTEPEFERAKAALAARAESFETQVLSGTSVERLRKMAYLGAAALTPPPLPAAFQLETLDLKTLRTLHRDHFVSSNTTVAISGGFDDATIEELLRTHLARIPVGRVASLPAINVPRQSTERFSMAEDPTAKVPAVWYGWRIPEGEAALPLKIALEILVSEPRLGRNLLSSYGPAKGLQLVLEDARTGATARLLVEGRQSHSLELVENALDKVTKELGTQAPTVAEIDAARRTLQERARESLVTPLDRARLLGQAVQRGERARSVLDPLLEAPEDTGPNPELVRQAAFQALGRRARSVVEVYPKGWKDPWQAPMPTFHIVSPGETLSHIARQHDTTIEVIAKMNGLNQKSPIYPGDKLKVPRGKPKPKLQVHTVKGGETLSGLAVRYGVSTAAIAEQNGLSTKQVIRVGQTLEIPSKTSASSPSTPKGPTEPTATTPSPASGREHVVSAGETLGGIARKYSLTTTELARANGLGNQAKVKIGQKLRIPPPESSSPQKVDTDALPAKKGTANTPTQTQKALPQEAKSPIVHTVKSGDTLSAIALRYATSAAAISQANGLGKNATIRVGQKLRIPR